ncbi:transcription factor [uncultured Clostridium sp.]|uniref:transcription factor n=1 Tax=uncultured Clostridium sp. TaxID=59620 RepID=UPI0025F944DB|nr:transcription factor [uncultured Clostridium sp.]
MGKTLFSRKDLMERWGVSYQSIVNYENNGTLTRNPYFESPMYYLEEVLKIESLNGDINPLSPLEKRRLEKRIQDLEKERDLLKGKVDIIKATLA